MSLALSTERQVAISAVRRACALTSSVFNNLAKNEVLTKDDKSPATGMLLIPERRPPSWHLMHFQSGGLFRSSSCECHLE
jgi:hypothetical protein